MRASPRPSRGRGSDGVELDRPGEGGLRLGGPDPGQVREPEHRLGASQARRQVGRLAGRLEGPVQVPERRADLGEPRPREGVFGLERDGLLQARAGALQVERGLLRVGQGDLRGRRLRVGRDRPAGQREGLLVLVPRHGHDRLQREGVGVVLGQLQGLVEVLAGLLDAARGQQERRPVGEEPRVADVGGREALEAGERPVEVALAPGAGGFLDLGLPGGALTQLAGPHGEDREVVERPLHGIAGAHRDRAHGCHPLARGGRLAAGELQASRVVLRQHLALENGEARALAVRLDGQDELGAAHRGDGAAGGEPRRPFLPAHHVRPEAAEEHGDVPLRRGLVDLHARLGADAEHRAVGAEAHRGPAALGDDDVVPLQGRARRRGQGLPRPDDHDLARGGFERREAVAGRAGRAGKPRPMAPASIRRRIQVVRRRPVIVLSLCAFVPSEARPNRRREKAARSCSGALVR